MAISHKVLALLSFGLVLTVIPLSMIINWSSQFCDRSDSAYAPQFCVLGNKIRVASELLLIYLGINTAFCLWVFCKNSSRVQRLTEGEPNPDSGASQF